MNIFKIIKALALHTGILLLTASQAKPRKNVLNKLPTLVKTLKLSADDLALLTGNNADTELALYELTGQTQFKIGECIGYSGDINKLQATFLQTAAEALAPPPTAPVKTAAKPDAAPDPELVALMAHITPEQLNAKGVPDKAAVIALLGRKVSAADIAAAWAAHQAASQLPAGASTVDAALQDVINAVLSLDIDDDNNYAEDGGTPKLEIIAGIVGRNITDAELQAALDEIERQPTNDGAS